MNAFDLLPFQTAFDPPQQVEGTLDPLGLYSIADALGVRLAPGIRERQRTPRFLTLALVGHAACEGLDEVPSPNRPPAWLVYEWLIVSALVDRLQGNEDLRGIPGQEKIKECMARHEAICASNYLKTPSVFGFHGIYRIFGTKAGLFDSNGNIYRRGHDVLYAWQRDQKLSGFLEEGGEVGKVRSEIRSVVKQGQVEGRLGNPSRPLREWIAIHLNPYRPGLAEQGALWDAVTATDELRGEYALLLVSGDGQRDWFASDGSESHYHKRIIHRCGNRLQHLLRAVQRFERLARLLTDAFDEARFRMSSEISPVNAEWLGQGRCMKIAAKECNAAFSDALELLGDIDPTARGRLEEQFAWAGEPTDASSFATRLLDHHAKVQHNKPPNGKRPWFDAFGDGRVAIRPGYTLKESEAKPGRYVHAYRTRPIWDFAVDLGYASGEAK